MHEFNMSNSANLIRSEAKNTICHILKKKLKIKIEDFVLTTDISTYLKQAFSCWCLFLLNFVSYIWYFWHRRECVLCTFAIYRMYSLLLTTTKIDASLPYLSVVTKLFNFQIFL